MWLGSDAAMLTCQWKWEILYNNPSLKSSLSVGQEFYAVLNDHSKPALLLPIQAPLELVDD